jgi:L-alanine-DL-glutamate epimerase-like enolase superfamily enzyme
VHAYSSVTETCLVKITTDDGTVGWGEAQSPLTPQTPCALITTLLGPALLGQPATATSALYDRLYHLMLARGHTGGFLMDAIAGLDTALWDIKGRKSGAPVFELLGGPYQLDMPCYVSGLRVKGLDQKVAAAKRFVEQGFAGVKIFSGTGSHEMQQEAHAIREAVGRDAFFAVDAICKYNLSDATHIGRTLDALRASWFEAPLNAEDVDGHAALARAIATPVAIGETLRTARQFEPWLRSRALAIAQPDVMRAGITATMRIAALTDAAHVPVTLHTGVCTGVGMAATWQVAAALPSGGLPQEHQHDLFDKVNSILKEPLVQRNGRLVVPQRPGIGVDVLEPAVEALASEHWVVDPSGRRQEKGTPRT